MSSVLNALKQHNQHQASEVSGHLQPATAQARPLKASRAIAIGCFGLLAGIGLSFGWSSLQSTTTDNARPVEKLSLGEPKEVRVVSLPEPEEIVEEAPIRTIVEPIPENEPQRGIDLEQINPELLAAFEDAVAATSDDEPSNLSEVRQASVVPLLTDVAEQLPQAVPAFSYEGHNYVSRVERRWVQLDGQLLREGDFLGTIEVVGIEPSHVVLAIDQQAFRQPALEDWTGQP